MPKRGPEKGRSPLSPAQRPLAPCCISLPPYHPCRLFGRMNILFDMYLLHSLWSKCVQYMVLYSSLLKFFVRIILYDYINFHWVYFLSLIVRCFSLCVSLSFSLSHSHPVSLSWLLYLMWYNINIIMWLNIWSTWLFEAVCFVLDKKHI